MDEEYVEKAIKENTENLVMAITENRTQYLEKELDRIKERAKTNDNCRIETPSPFNWAVEEFVRGCCCKKESPRCKGCIFLDRYRDMGMSMDICTLEEDLTKANEATECWEECPHKLTFKEAREYVKNRDTKC